MLYSFLDSKITPTAPIPNLPSEPDTTPTPALQAATPIKSLSWGNCTWLTPIQVRAKARVWGNEHIKWVPHMHSYSNHLLVLHNTCHCLPLHHQICAALSHQRISPELSQVTSRFANSLPGGLDAGPLGCWCKTTLICTLGVKWDFSQMDLSQNVTSDNPRGREWAKRICFESGTLIVAKSSLAKTH